MSTVYTVAEFLALGAAASAKNATFTIEDTAANVSAAFGDLFANPDVRAIIVSDNGAVSLPPADFFEALSPGLYGRLLSIANANGSAVRMSALNAQTVSVLEADEARRITPSPIVSDTLSNIAAALASLNTDAHVTSIWVQDGGTLSLTAAQYIADIHALGEIVSTTPLIVTAPSGSKGQAFTATNHNTSWTITGATAESFVFQAGFGQDVIAGYAPGQDSISISHTLFANFAAMFSHTASDGKGDVVITYNANETLTLTNVTLAQVQAHASDFHFI
jgi:hypothetical protein